MAAMAPSLVGGPRSVPRPTTRSPFTAVPAAVTALFRGETAEWLSVRAATQSTAEELVSAFERDHRAGLEPKRSIAIRLDAHPQAGPPSSGIVIEARSRIAAPGARIISTPERIAIAGPGQEEIQRVAVEAARDLQIPISRSRGRIVIEPLPEHPVIARMAEGIDDRQRARRLATEIAARLAGLPASSGIRHDSSTVHRIVFGDRPSSPIEQARLEYVYGTSVLFDAHEAPRTIRGTVIHNDLSEEPVAFFGQANPALECLAEHGRYGDRWEEHLLLDRVAPELSPRTILGSDLSALAGPHTGERDQRALLASIQAELAERFDGRFVLKIRKGFNSEAHLPTDQDDLVKLWDRFLFEFVPKRAKLRQEIIDPVDLNARLNETVSAAAGQVLEALLSDPSSVVVQERLIHKDELRVHVIRGRILAGGTISRWDRDGRPLGQDDVRGAERAVERMLERLQEPLSFGLDMLVTDGGFAIVDLNAGLQSGMYFPEYDLYVTNLLAERFLGHETPFLYDFRAFARAPLDRKLESALAMERLIGDFPLSDGFYDRIVAAYFDELRADPRADTKREIERQLSMLKVGPRLIAELEAFAGTLKGSETDSELLTRPKALYQISEAKWRRQNANSIG